MITRKSIRVPVKPMKWWVALLIALLVILRLIGVFPHLPNSVVLASYAICIAYYISTKPRIDSLNLAFLGLLLLALILASPDEVFRSELRFALFCAVFLVVSTLLQSIDIRYAHRKALVFICRIGIVLTIISFICFFLGINLMSSQYTDSGYVEDYQNMLGGFSGIFIHSMVLGPMASISAIYTFDKALRKGKLVYWGAWVLCVGAVFMAASRAALFALLIASAVVLFSLRKQGRIGGKIVIIAVVVALLLPSAGFITSRVMEKQRQREEMGQGVFDSRNEKFTYRLQEFEEHPFQGVGFAAIDPDLGDNYNPSSGVIEPGSSWLFVLSMAGILGFIPFLLIIIRAWKSMNNVAKDTLKKETDYFLIRGVFVFFLIHIMFEGYLFSAGNPMCMLVWLVISCAYELGQRIKPFEKQERSMFGLGKPDGD